MTGRNVTAVTATDRLRRAVESELAHGGSAPAALVHLQAYPGESLEAWRLVLGVSQPAAVRVVNRLVTERIGRRPRGPRPPDWRAAPHGGGRPRGLRAPLTTDAKPEGLLEVLEPDEQAALEPLLERLVAALADDRSHALRVCRLCDRRSCQSAPGCPLDHTSETGR
jgi:MarR family transcriptional repressor of emrRAB